MADGAYHRPKTVGVMHVSETCRGHATHKINTLRYKPPEGALNNATGPDTLPRNRVGARGTSNPTSTMRCTGARLG